MLPGGVRKQVETWEQNMAKSLANLCQGWKQTGLTGSSLVSPGFRSAGCTYPVTCRGALLLCFPRDEHLPSTSALALARKRGDDTIDTIRWREVSDEVGEEVKPGAVCCGQKGGMGHCGEPIPKSERRELRVWMG